MSNRTDTNDSNSLRTILRATASGSLVAAFTRTVLSRIRRGADRFSDYARSSVLYEWLTKEPDPEVVVIDLRETYTVGPLIGILDSLHRSVASFGKRFGSYWHHSQVSRVSTWSCHQIHRVADTHIGRTILRLFTSPSRETERDQD